MKRFSNILYVSEGSVTQDAALARAVSMAQNNQADLTVADVVPAIRAGAGAVSGGPASVDLQTALKTERRQALETLISSHRQDLDIRVEVLTGRKFLEVIRAVLRKHHDLVIKPAEDPDWIDRLFGSDDMHLLRKCPCPVWLTKPEEKSKYDCIVAAIDFDPDDPDPDEQILNLEILELASSLALSDFANLHILHVWDAFEAGFVRLWADDPHAAKIRLVEGARLRHQRGMEALNQKLRQQIGTEAWEYLSPRVHMPKGTASKTIPGLVRELKADLVVMGTVARTGVAGLIIGNTAEAVLDQLRCPVLAVKPPGFVSPVMPD
ncbi:MAG: universal stress protein [Candidatus Competibacterales bacterium]|nr:universal stress protein [Candidatus Competibacterales bacterium]